MFQSVDKSNWYLDRVKTEEPWFVVESHFGHFLHIEIKLWYMDGIWHFQAIGAILSSFCASYILLNQNFYQLAYKMHQTNILIVISQFTMIMYFSRLMIIIAIILLILFLIHCINNGMVFTNKMCNSDNCKIFDNVLNYVISNDNIIFAHW